MKWINQVIIWGCGGHSRTVADVILFNDPGATLVFVDKSAQENEKIFGFNVMKNYPINRQACILAIGDNEHRKRKFEEIKHWANLISVVSNDAFLGRNCKIKTGSFVAHTCHIGPEACIDENTIINTAAVIEHETNIGKHCHIGPNASISGRTKIGDMVFIGVGATVIDRLNICSNVIVGAGATVVADIIYPGVYVGTPARKI